MKPAVSWRIEGIAPLARESAREAARRAGLSLGEWLNAAIIDSASDALAQKPASRTSEDNPGKLAEAIARLSERLEELVEGRANAEITADTSGQPAQPFGDHSSDLDQAVAEIAARQRSLDGVTDSDTVVSSTAGVQEVAHEETVAPPTDGEAVSPTGADTVTATAEPSEPTVSGAPNTPPQAEIPMQSVPGLERYLAHISEQIEMLQRPNRFEADLTDLRRDLAEIKQSLAGTPSRAAADAMEDRIRAHAATRPDWSREDADDMAAAGEFASAFYEPLNHNPPAENLAELEEEVSALSRRVETVAASGADGATMQHLETAIAELRRLSDSVASGEAVTKLADNVREVAEKIDRLDTAVGGMDAISALERRLEPFGGSFAEYAALRSGGAAAAPDNEAPAKEASERQEILESVRAERAALEQLEGQITKLAEKLEVSDERMSQVGAIERTLADLFMHIEDTRIGAIEAAERAAKAAALEISTAEAGERAAVEMLQRELMELRETQSHNERRTQQTLESVHEAVQHMIDRMASMDFSRPAEVQAPRPPAEAPAAPPTAVSAPAVAVSAQPAPPAPPPPSFPVARRPAAEPIAPPPPKPSSAPVRTAPPVPPAAPSAPPVSVERRAIDPTLPADTPLEPGSGAPRVRPGSPAERIAASEAALGAAKPAAPASDKANFIAAARRAAQAAAADAAGAETPGEAESEAKTGGFGQLLGRHRRSLLMAVAAVAILAGGVQVVTRYAKMTGSTPDVAARATQTTEAPLTLASDPDLNTAADPSRTPAPAANPPAAPRTDGIAQNIADNPAGSAAMEYVADTTGSLAKTQTTAALPPLAPTAPSVAPPAPSTTTASLDPPKLPTGITPNLRAAAASGDPAAAYEVATRFAEGRDVPMSMEEAARWFTRAADQGLAPAQYRLGSLYEKGQGVKKDIEAARRLYVSASEKGNAKAMHNLAVLYAEGIDGKADYRTASQWFRKAAERGLADSQYNLGILCARGIGMDRNLAESYKWFSLAAAQGDQDAGRKRDDVAQRLDAQSLAAAKVSVQSFVPELQPDEAINVKAPPGGWDRAAVTTVPVKPKNAPNRKVGST